MSAYQCGYVTHGRIVTVSRLIGEGCGDRDCPKCDGSDESPVRQSRQRPRAVSLCCCEPGKLHAVAVGGEQSRLSPIATHDHRDIFTQQRSNLQSIFPHPTLRGVFRAVKSNSQTLCGGTCHPTHDMGGWCVPFVPWSIPPPPLPPYMVLLGDGGVRGASATRHCAAGGCVVVEEVTCWRPTLTDERPHGQRGVAAPYATNVGGAPRHSQARFHGLAQAFTCHHP